VADTRAAQPQPARPQAAGSPRRVWLGDLLVVATFHVVLLTGIVALVAGVLLNVQQLRWLGQGILVLYGLAMIAGMLASIVAGAIFPVHFVRTWRQQSTSERLVLTPLVALLVLLMLILVAAVIGLLIV
jgi:hypothetical protein